MSFIEIFIAIFLGFLSGYAFFVYDGIMVKRMTSFKCPHGYRDPSVCREGCKEEAKKALTNTK